MEATKDVIDAVAEGAKNGAASSPLELDPAPEFLQRRRELFDRLQEKYEQVLARKPNHPITITLSDGTVKEGIAWQTTPGQIARAISSSLYKRTVVARLNNDSKQLWDLERPLEQTCTVEFVPFDDEDGQKVFWHSSAHILGEACERRFGCSLCIGPPVTTGFYYEMALPSGAAVTEADWKPLETIVRSIVKEKQKFERLEVSKEDLLEMFSYNKYKQYIINDKIPDGTSTTVYRNGPLIDLCLGPHVPDTGRIEAFAIMKNSASYFLGNQANDSLQRIWGVSFPDKKKMVEHKKFLEEAAKRDHRKIGQDQELFFFHEVSPGSTFWLPHGTRIVNTLFAYIKEQYWKRGYQEVVTPNMYSADLWKTSGHWEHYKDDMFVIRNIKGETSAAKGTKGYQMGLKPMNCPSHCLIFNHRERSYKELPWRVADFGVLHRNEASGALSGITRVRRFQQDDAHIFCREDQIRQEIDDQFDFLREMYGMLGFTYSLKLSTRPEKFMGDIETWNRAEGILEEALDGFAEGPGGVPWSLNPGDGAFYGPKIDIKIYDSMQRPWQCATVQLDFVQPQNFNLQYVTAEGGVKKAETVPAETSRINLPKLKYKKPQDVMASAAAARGTGEAPDIIPAAAEVNREDQDGKEGKKEKVYSPVAPGCARPVMIHRAMAGSMERFMGILCEHFAGKWPFWLSPRQIMIVPIGKGFYTYAEEVRALLNREHMYVDVDLSGNTPPKKIALAQGETGRYNFTFIVGAEEKEGRKVNVRYRDDQSTQNRGTPVPLAEAIAKLRKLRADRGVYNPFQPDTIAEPSM